MCCRLVHAFTCAGILPSQYIHFSKFATIGVVGKWYIRASELCRCLKILLIDKFGYMDIINECVKLSMIKVKALPNYPQAGKVSLHNNY